MMFCLLCFFLIWKITFDNFLGTKLLESYRGKMIALSHEDW